MQFRTGNLSEWISSLGSSHLPVLNVVIIDTCLTACYKRNGSQLKLGIIPPCFLPGHNCGNNVLGRGCNIVFNSQVTMLPLTRTRHRDWRSTGASRPWILTSQTHPTLMWLTPSSRVTMIGNSPSRETRRPLWSWGSLLTLSEEIHYSTWQLLRR